MKISQREAHRLKKRVVALEEQEDRRRGAWASDYPGGTVIGSVEISNPTCPAIAEIHTARLLGHAVIALESGKVVTFVALPLARSRT